ncbi:MAG TPA: ABC transporter ATP-binding protein [Ktedonosporobacter sp.]|jgi:molybdate transport system ATP-binding protein|nr:ABC transporter ATP-binding protein [Ktedonosporobacter sp.]
MLNVALDTHLDTFHLAVDFQVEKGKTLVLLGESGAGKSTVLRLLAGLLYPEKGHISLDGVVYFDSEQRIAITPQQRPFGYVFQDYVLFPHLTVFENVAFGLRAQRVARHSVQQRVMEALEQVHMADLAQRRPAQLSGGQQQRVAIARALVLQPELLLLDEPLAALDVQTRREVRQELRRLLAETGITTVLVTHHYLEALLFGERILVLDHGRVIQQGDQYALREYPRSSYIAELVGVNFFRGHITRYEANSLCIVQLDDDKLSVEVVAALRERGQSNGTPSSGDEAFVVVDPRSITLYLAPPESSARNVFYGEIVHILPSRAAANGDSSVRVSIMLNDATPPLTAEITEASANRLDLQEGKMVYATFKATEASAYT